MPSDIKPDQGLFPPPGQPIVIQADGRPTQTMANLLAALKEFLRPGNQPITQTDFVSVVVVLPLVKEYRIVEQIPYDVTLTQITAKTLAGTTTIKLQINGVDVTGSGMVAAVGQATQNLTAANAAAANATISLIVTANTGSDLSVTIDFTRQIGTT